MDFPDANKYGHSSNYSRSSRHDHAKKYSRQTGSSRMSSGYSTHQNNNVPAYGSNSVYYGDQSGTRFGKILRWITLFIVIAFILRACA